MAEEDGVIDLDLFICNLPAKTLRILGRLLLYFWETAVDWLLLLLAGVAILALWFQPPRLDQLFPFPPTIPLISLSYPHLPPIYSPAVTGTLAAIVPLTTFALFQLHYASVLDFYTALLGLGQALITGTLVQLIFKKLIGGFRPHFYAVCRPVIVPATSGTGFGGVMYSVADVCNADDTWDLHNAMESFPSGHAEIAFAGFGFLSLYLLAHLRVLTPPTESRDSDALPPHADTATTASMTSRAHFRGNLRYVRMALVVAPLVFATYLSATLVTGYQHHVHDVIAGAVIGMLSAGFAYGNVFEEWGVVSRVRARHGKGREDVGGLGMNS